MSLDCEMRQILAEMELFQYGTTVNWEPNTSSGEKTYGRPPGSSKPAHDYWRYRYEHASSRSKVLSGASKALEATRKAKPLEVELETQEQLEHRVVTEGVGWSLKDISNHCRVTPKMARKAREKAKVSLEDGKPLPESLTTTQRRREVSRMRAAGVANRQIAWMLSCDEITVRRDVIALSAGEAS
jgi:hypothetical protein